MLVHETWWPILMKKNKSNWSPFKLWCMIEVLFVLFLHSYRGTRALFGTAIAKIAISNSIVHFPAYSISEDDQHAKKSHGIRQDFLRLLPYIKPCMWSVKTVSLWNSWFPSQCSLSHTVIQAHGAQVAQMQWPCVSGCVHSPCKPKIFPLSFITSNL
jgi:hypothetical protein